MIRKSEFFALHFLSFFFFFTFFAAMLKWSLKLVSCRTNTSLSVCNMSLQSRVPNTILTLQVRKIIYRKVSSRHSKKEESYVPCSSFLTPRSDKELIQEWTGFFVTAWFLRHKKTTAELTERVSDVLGGLPPPVCHRQERSTFEKVS